MIYKLSKSQVVILITHLLTDDNLRFNAESKTAMIYFIQHNFFLIVQDKFRIKPFVLDVKNDFMIQNYKEIFLSDAISSKISLFFT